MLWHARWSPSVSASKMRIAILWRPSKHASPFYDSFKNLHSDVWRPWKVHLLCVSASTMRIAILWRPLKLCICFFMSLAKMRMMVYEDHETNASPLYERFNNVQHGFMKALKIVQLPFMCLPKICSTICEGRQNMHLLCTGASTRRITVLWRP